MSRLPECGALLAPPVLMAALWGWNAWRCERRSRRLARTLERGGRL